MVAQRRLTVLACLAVAGCFPMGPALEGESDPNTCDETFDDHTHVGPIDVPTLERLRERPDAARVQTVDFVVVYVSDAERRRVRFEDGAFYVFHDQWYWFRLMNGVSACGSSATPVRGRSFATVQEIEASLKDQPVLPLDLERTADGRIVSPSFYTLSLRVKPRVYATGTLFRYVDAGREDRYAFELAFVDAVTAEELIAIHSTVQSALPGGASLFWRAVSPVQGERADGLEAPLSARVLRVGEEPP